MMGLPGDENVTDTYNCFVNILPADATTRQTDRQTVRQTDRLTVAKMRVTGRLHGTIVGPTGRPDPGYVRLSVRPVGQTVAEPPTSVNQINVAC